MTKIKIKKGHLVTFGNQDSWLPIKQQAETVDLAELPAQNDIIQTESGECFRIWRRLFDANGDINLCVYPFNKTLINLEESVDFSESWKNSVES